MRGELGVRIILFGPEGQADLFWGCSVFTISMATLVALEEPCLSEVAVLPGVARGLGLAVEIFANVADVSLSLGEMSVILNDRVLQSNVSVI
jgi:hypothetical protein